MRYGATHRGFESLPLRHLASPAERVNGRSELSPGARMRRWFARHRHLSPFVPLGGWLDGRRLLSRSPFALRRTVHRSAGTSTVMRRTHIPSAGDPMSGDERLHGRPSGAAPCGARIKRPPNVCRVAERRLPPDESCARRITGMRRDKGRGHRRWCADGICVGRSGSPPAQTRAFVRWVRAPVESVGRARRGTSGALYLQSAPAGLNSHPRPAFADADGEIDVEDRVPRSGDA